MYLTKIKNITYILALITLMTSGLKAADECFEGTSRAIFKFNMAFDNAILEPVAKGYNKLPAPIKNGTSNFTSNIGETNGRASREPCLQWLEERLQQDDQAASSAWSVILCRRENSYSACAQNF